ncbi:hypothetical protein HMPREF0765_3852 [Sphingobacterium spiritivorum ATCC 33300]|uniref:Acyl-protein synthetase LuxE domain-containing protein n=1 Tax=Sphingobacterium spiritivorum ATCC 33300 TaxID=525372 RepID=C2G2P6_SPHSI|nr:hypothetical protein [Sphingobacterium spiritivorum]EEI90536.1 hypothetical protein HMPREF0765_3852 [Sphingobacterium spiritivorum ATCC 33300]
MDTQQIFEIQCDEQFNDNCLSIFRYQYDHCQTYKQYVDYLHIDTKDISHYTQIPFLPIELFKSQEIITSGSVPQVTFSSSGTTGMITSKHLVADAKLYESSFRKLLSNSTVMSGI